MKTESIVAGKAYAFALEVIKLYKFLVERKEFVLSKQLVRSGTSIGANINESVSAQSKRDFVHKLSISLKEGRESIYWLKLLKDSNYIEEGEFVRLNNSCEEIIRMLTKIILTTKERYFKQDSKL